MKPVQSVGSGLKEGALHFLFLAGQKCSQDQHEFAVDLRGNFPVFRDLPGRLTVASVHFGDKVIARVCSTGNEIADC